jgi:polyhydroxyalkanoate synthesis regulator protein
MVYIRKYENRKMYRTDEAVYVSMLGIGDIVSGGQSVQVTCDRTGRDITLETLARALYERLKSRSKLGELPFDVSRLERLFAKVERDS